MSPRPDTTAARQELDRITGELREGFRLNTCELVCLGANAVFVGRTLADALDSPPPAPCPTCSGPSRETVGLVCQTCGTDYSAAPDSDDVTAVTAVLHEHIRVSLDERGRYLPRYRTLAEDAVRALDAARRTRGQITVDIDTLRSVDAICSRRCLPDHLRAALDGTTP